uniref:Uncharacterized protein n=1 Tax=Romanomermis culicivorax TaxID=13658 RepID=A0A915JBK4_ROMCU
MQFIKTAGAPCLDDQRRKHLHRNGAPQKDQKDITHPTDTSEGPLAQAPACSQQALENPLGDPHKLVCWFKLAD